MKTPEEYFDIRKEDGCTIYEWRESARLIVAGLIVIALFVKSFVKTFIDHAAPPYVFIITMALGLVVLIFFWVYDRFRLVIDKEGVIRYSYISPMSVNPGAKELLSTLKSIQNG